MRIQEFTGNFSIAGNNRHWSSAAIAEFCGLRVLLMKDESSLKLLYCNAASYVAALMREFQSVQSHGSIMFLTAWPNVKVMSICIAPIYETSLRRSGIAHINHQGITPFYLHTHTLRFIRKWNELYNAFAFPAAAGAYLPTPEE